MIFTRPDYFLITEIFTSKYIMIDYWSLTHLFWGLLLGFLSYRFFKKTKFKWLWALLIMVLYEVLEIVMLNGLIFVSEPYANIAWDIIIGMMGYFLFKVIIKIRKRKR